MAKNIARDVERQMSPMSEWFESWVVVGRVAGTDRCSVVVSNGIKTKTASKLLLSAMFALEPKGKKKKKGKR